MSESHPPPPAEPQGPGLAGGGDKAGSHRRPHGWEAVAVIVSIIGAAWAAYTYFAGRAVSLDVSTVGTYASGDSFGPGTVLQVKVLNESVSRDVNLSQVKVIYGDKELATITQAVGDVRTLKHADRRTVQNSARELPVTLPPGQAAIVALVVTDVSPEASSSGLAALSHAAPANADLGVVESDTSYCTPQRSTSVEPPPPPPVKPAKPTKPARPAKRDAPTSTITTSTAPASTTRPQAPPPPQVKATTATTESAPPPPPPPAARKPVTAGELTVVVTFKPGGVKRLTVPIVSEPGAPVQPNGEDISPGWVTLLEVKRHVVRGLVLSRPLSDPPEVAQVQVWKLYGPSASRTIARPVASGYACLPFGRLAPGAYQWSATADGHTVAVGRFATPCRRMLPADHNRSVDPWLCPA